LTRLPDLYSEEQRGNSAVHWRIVDAIVQQTCIAKWEMRAHLDKLKQIYIDVPILIDPREA
jgi:hypothetical protein